MSTIKGIQGIFQAEDGHEPVGRCAVLSQDFVWTEIECPLCQATKLKHVLTAAGRNILATGNKIGAAVEVIVDPLPPGYRAVHCSLCKVTFYQPPATVQVEGA